MKKYVGQMLVDLTPFKLYVTDDVHDDREGGGFEGPSEKCNHGVMRINLDKEWFGVLSSILHEIEEFMLVTMGYAYEPLARHAMSYIDRSFVLSHQDYAEVCQRVARPLARAVDLIRPEWEAHQKRRKKKDAKH